MSVHWITPILAAAAWDEGRATVADALVDVRALRDAHGNSAGLLAQKISEVEVHLRAGRRTVVCCDHGQSRSNAIAAAALARVEGIGFDVALKRVLSVTRSRGMKIDLLVEVRAALGESGAFRPTAGGSAVMLASTERFLGLAVEAALVGDGREVVAVDAKTALANPALLEQSVRSCGATCLVFLARAAVPDSNDGMGELLSGVRGALEVCRALSLHLVFLSGHQVYAGHQGAETSFDENAPARPAGAVGEALYLAEQLIELHSRRDGVEALIVRACPVFGAGDRRPGFLRTFIQHALRGEEIATHHYRNGEPAVQLLDARDFAAGVALAVQHRLGGCLHLATDGSITTSELARAVVRIVGSASRVGRVDLPGDTANVILDASRARSLLGWGARITLEQGLSELIADQRATGTIN